jgi:predicted flap endonuclease-1-like 5' DNA nuclease
VAPSAPVVLTVATPELAEPEPVAIGRVEGEEKHEGQRPIGFVAPRGGKADDLKRIRGIGPQNEGRLHALGVWHFAQIAAWTRDNVRWVGSYLAFPGRIDREKWIEQAQALTSRGETAFSKPVESGELAKSQDDGSLGQNNIADLSQIKPHA